MKTPIDPKTGLRDCDLEPADRNAFVKVADLCDQILAVRLTNGMVKSGPPYRQSSAELLAVDVTLRKLLSDGTGIATEQEPADDADGKGETDAK